MCATEKCVTRTEAQVEGHKIDAEGHVFEERLGSDSALLDELQGNRVTRRAWFEVTMAEHERTALKGNVVRLRTWHWAAAAAVVLLLSGGAWYLLQTKSSLPALAERYAVQESPLPVFMSGASKPQVVMDEAMQAYGMGDHITTIERLAQLPPTDTTLFFTGLAQAELGKDATFAFEAVAQRPNSPLRNKALYHMMLYAMRTNNAPMAQRIWNEQIAMKYHPYRDRLEANANCTGWRP